MTTCLTQDPPDAEIYFRVSVLALLRPEIN